ncbi:MAG: peptide deformylase [Alphaproteobacteria bacterium]|nr:peptide deformylase [Alphaproteobacteria bacterium]
MALLPIIHAPDPRLKVKSARVDTVDDGLRRLMDDMLETMYAAPGIGLAAIQVGVPKRVIVIDVAREDEPRAPLFLVNPEIVAASDEDATYEEGCLSLPGQFADVARPAWVEITYLDRAGAPRRQRAEGLLATCVQHEMDHLEGILFVDHISALKRNMILRRLLKQRRQQSVGD